MRTQLGIIGANGVAIAGVSVEAITHENEILAMGVNARKHGTPEGEVDTVVFNTAINEIKRGFASQGAVGTRYFPI